MSRHKKGNTLHAKKIDKAHHRNEFIARLAKFCDDVTDAKTFQLIPPQIARELYVERIQPPRLKTAFGHEIHDGTLRDAKALITLMFKHTMVPLGIGRITDISVYDFITLGFTLLLYAQRIKDTDYAEAAAVKEKLSVLISDAVMDAFDSSNKHMQDNMNLVSLYYSNLDNQLCAVKAEIRSIVDGRHGVMFCMEIYTKKTQVEVFMLDGANRPAYRVGLYTGLDFDNIRFASVRSEQVFMAPGKQLSVYIQSHALQRLIERIDCVETGVLHYYLFDSLTNLKASRNRKGELLLELWMDHKKLGYFVAVIIEDSVLIRTFLFLTNNGTPEGEKLHANTGIMKEDKIFLQIDKLSTFIASDIGSNERLRDIFINAGCGSLFEVDIHFTYIDSKGPRKQVAEYISNYLKKDR